MRQLNHPGAELQAAAATATEADDVSWNSGTNAVKQFKRKFREWALRNQNERCAFCCFPLGHEGPRRAFAIDHFAPKGSTLYPQWTFEPLNLILTCWSCNSHFKLVDDTVQSAATTYAASLFTYVHPYLHDVESHIIGTYQGDSQLVVVPEAKTAIGEKTIEAFALANVDYLKAAKHEATRVLLDQVQSNLAVDIHELLRKGLAEAAGI